MTPLFHHISFEQQLEWRGGQAFGLRRELLSCVSVQPPGRLLPQRAGVGVLSADAGPAVASVVTWGVSVREPCAALWHENIARK